MINWFNFKRKVYLGNKGSTFGALGNLNDYAQVHLLTSGRPVAGWSAQPADWRPLAQLVLEAAQAAKEMANAKK